MQAHPDVNLLWTTDAGSGFVAQVIKEQGLEGKVLAVGTDRTAEQLAAIKDGTGQCNDHSGYVRRRVDLIAIPLLASQWSKHRNGHVDHESGGYHQRQCRELV